MHRKLKLLGLFFLVIHSLSAQTSIKEIKPQWTIHQQIDSLCSWSWEIRKSQAEDALLYAEAALKLSKQSDNEYYLSKTLFYKATALNNLGKPEDALSCYYESEQYINPKTHPKLAARVYNGIGLASTDIGKYDKSIEYYEKAIAVYKAQEDTEGVALQLQNLGVVYYLIGRTDEALANYLKAIETLENLESATPEILANNYTNTAIVFMEIQDYDKAIAHFNKAEKIYQNKNDIAGLAHVYLNKGVMYYDINQDSALFYHNSALKNFRKTGNHINAAVALSYAADVQRDLGQFDTALMKYDSAIYTLSSEGFTYGEISARIGKGILLRETGQYLKSIESLEKSMELAESIDALNLQISASLELSNTYAKQENFKAAYEYHKAHKALSDSLLNKEKLEMIKSLEYSYETEKRQRKITELTSKQSIMRLRFLAFISIFVLITVALIIFIYKQNTIRKKEKLHESMQRKLNETKLNSTQSELNLKKKLLLNYALRVTEKNKLLADISEGLKQISGKEKPYTQRLISSIKINLLLPGEREELNELIAQAGEDFFKKINHLSQNLTNTEQRVCVFLAFGFSSKDIAGLMNISSKTIDNYRSSIRKKLEIPDSVQLQSYFKTLLEE
jgi:tetratricopeptide (TPR) repeat protein/DNA-binding CsgD family transcriptional regulator